MFMKPPRDDKQALYQQIARQLRDAICRRYQPGEFLPSEQELALRYEVNRHTLRRAVDELIDAGLVERRRGRGTLVIDPAIIFPIRSRTRFTESMETMGNSCDSRLLFACIAAVTPETASELDLTPGDEVVWLELQRLVEQEPVSVSTIFLAAKRFGGLIEAYRGGSLHAHLETNYQLQLRRKRSLITAVMPQTEEAHALRLPRNRPVLRCCSVNVDISNDQPIEYCISRFRADRCQLEIRP
jgi:GntR family transcriptional regulator, phosphonate transport system regulatory protein